MAKINADGTNRTTDELAASLKKTLTGSALNIAGFLKIINLPGLGEGDDAADWLEKEVQARDMEMEKNG